MSKNKGEDEDEEEEKKHKIRKKEYKALKLPVQLYDFYDDLRKRYPEWGFSLASQLILHVLQQYSIERIEKNPGLAKFNQKVDYSSLEPKIESLIGLKPQDIDVLKMNIEKEVMIYAIWGCFFKKKILILIEKKIEHLKQILENFFEFIFLKTFDNNNILIRTNEDYKNNKNIDGDCITLTDREIKGKGKEIIKIDKLKIEGEIVKRFYKEGDSLTSLIELRDALKEIYTLSYKIYKFVEKHDKEIPLSLKDAILQIREIKPKISKDYIHFLINVARNYFNIEITLVKEKLADLLEEMWRQ